MNASACGGPTLGHPHPHSQQQQQGKSQEVVFNRCFIFSQENTIDEVKATLVYTL